MTTLRLRDNSGHTDGEWVAETVTAYHYKTLKDYREAEPNRGWHFETRGTETTWHKFEPNLQQMYEV